MTAQFLSVTDAQYDADPCEVPSLSQSIAHTLVTKSPAHAYTQHPRLGGVPREQTKATDQGEIIHGLLLGKGALVAVLEFENYRTKAAQTARDEARDGGLIPMLAKDYDGIVAAAAAVVRSLAARGIVLDGQSEVAMQWQELGNHGPVECRGKADHLKLGPSSGIIYDVKKIQSAEPRNCSNSAYAYGIDIQAAAYTSAVEKLHPKLAGRVEYRPIFVEIEPPYAVVSAPLDAVLRASGQQRWQRAIYLWERCLRENHWPAYENVFEIEAPGWLMAQMEREADL